MNTSERYKGTIYDFSDTSKMRGAWFTLLVNSALADYSTIEERIVLCKQIRAMCEYFQCLRCKAHFTRRLEAVPPEGEIDKKDGMFNWVVDFANHVSRTKSKEEYVHSVIYPMFHSSDHVSCTTGCDHENEGEPGSITFSSSRDKGRGYPMFYSERDRTHSRPTYEQILGRR